jgi:lysozyme
MMTLGPKGEALIKSFEKLCLAAYQDQKGIWTCGWGHTGADVGPTTICTPDQAETWFLEDTDWACKAVIRTVDVGLNQNQFDALVSFVFNVGAYSEAHSTLVSLLNRAQYALAADQFQFWNHTDGVVSDGLTRRRAAERDLFLGTST